ncbi:hypothetical protein JCM18694_26350 [Prolixibacter denitrificans]|uniref:Uncharacterized protein n=1 Tax=Prolixibacter denitrificans TaxID=1541063 RepID=A0ABQ0ZLW0_9BACT|nr:hypothetical protein JCM18694_26350 [Prolixibacter denitrificans]
MGIITEPFLKQLVMKNEQSKDRSISSKVEQSEIPTVRRGLMSIVFFPTTVTAKLNNRNDNNN